MIKNLYRSDLATSDWIGKVVDVNDPLKIGRIKVEVFGLFDKMDSKNIPWCYPSNNMTGGSDTGSGSISVPKLGCIVNVKFDNGNLYHPEYTSVHRISNELKSEISGSYDNAHSLIYDTITEGNLKIYFTENKGLVIDYKSSIINIKPDKSINISNDKGNTIIMDINGNVKVNVKKHVNIKSKSAKIESPKIDFGEKAYEAIIKGETFQKLFNSHTHLGNLGAPTGTPIVPLNGSELSKISKTE